MLNVAPGPGRDCWVLGLVNYWVPGLAASKTRFFTSSSSNKHAVQSLGTGKRTILNIQSATEVGIQEVHVLE